MATKKINQNKNKENCDCNDNCNCKCWKQKCGGGCGAVYGLGLIGAAIYFISHTSGFWNVVLAILKAIVWPVFIVLKILGL
jgi:hypothetical protein